MSSCFFHPGFPDWTIFLVVEIQVRLSLPGLVDDIEMFVPLVHAPGCFLGCCLRYRRAS
jgi:hypothetical protein